MIDSGVRLLFFFLMCTLYFQSFSPEDDHALAVEAREVDKIKLAGDFTIEKVFSIFSIIN